MCMRVCGCVCMCMRACGESLVYMEAVFFFVARNGFSYCKNNGILQQKVIRNNSVTFDLRLAFILCLLCFIQRSVGLFMPLISESVHLVLLFGDCDKRKAWVFSF